jgi:hypothetical protein
MAIDREKLKQTIIDEFGGNLHACLENAVTYYISAEQRIDQLEAEVAFLRRGFSYGAARAVPRRPARPLHLDTFAPLDIDKTASPNA